MSYEPSGAAAAAIFWPEESRSLFLDLNTPPAFGYDDTMEQGSYCTIVQQALPCQTHTGGDS